MHIGCTTKHGKYVLAALLVVSIVEIGHFHKVDCHGC